MKEKGIVMRTMVQMEQMNQKKGIMCRRRYLPQSRAIISDLSLGAILAPAVLQLYRFRNVFAEPEIRSAKGQRRIIVTDRNESQPNPSMLFTHISLISY